MYMSSLPDPPMEIEMVVNTASVLFRLFCWKTLSSKVTYVKRFPRNWIFKPQIIPKQSKYIADMFVGKVLKLDQAICLHED